MRLVYLHNNFGSRLSSYQEARSDTLVLLTYSNNSTVNSNNEADTNNDSDSSFIVSLVLKVGLGWIIGKPSIFY